MKAKPFYEYLEQQIAISGKAQKDIAFDIGYQPNVITMLKQGRTKVPVTKIEALAKSLGIDSTNLLRMAMKEYQPDTWSAIESIVGFAVSENEKEVIEIFRTSSNDSDPKLNASARASLKAVVKTLM